MRYSAFSTGELLYMDRQYVITTLPTELAGLHYIRTRNDDKALEENLTFDVNIPGEICVAYDLRSETRPGWLAQFADTGLVIETSDVVFGLLCKSVQSGSVVLGPNQARSMYYVVLR